MNATAPSLEETMRHCLATFRPEATCYAAEIANHERPAPDQDVLAMYLLDAHRASAHRLTGLHHRNHRTATLETLRAVAGALAREIIAGHTNPELTAARETSDPGPDTLTDAQAQALNDICRTCATGKPEPDLCEFCGFATTTPAPFHQ